MHEMDDYEFIYSDYSFGVLLCSKLCLKEETVQDDAPLHPWSLHSNWENPKYVTKHYVVEAYLTMWKEKKKLLHEVKMVIQQCTQCEAICINKQKYSYVCFSKILEGYTPISRQ